MTLRHILLIPLTLAFIQLTAQEKPPAIDREKAVLLYPKQIFNEENQNEAAMETYVFELLGIKDDAGYSVKLIHDIPSKYGHHLSFALYYKGIRIYRNMAKLNLDNSGRVLSFLYFFTPVDAKAKAETSALPAVPPIPVKANSRIDLLPVWFTTENGMEPVQKMEFINTRGLHVEYLIDKTGATVYQSIKSERLFAQDTVAEAYIYLPDPLTTANTIYSGNYVDNNDQTNPQLDAQRILKEIEVRYDNGVFILENDYVKITEHSLPDIQPATSTTPEFFFDRSQFGFEDVMALYHITEYQKYLRSLGFTNLANYQIHVDTHGFNGDDQSSFNYFTSPPSLTFGQGGVDDAEDADVIIHEYGHGILYSAAPNSNSGTERRAIEEGMGDYFAASYSKMLNNYHWDWVFNWDGHNEFWPGRKATTTKRYPDDLNYNLYIDAPIWSSTLMQIEELTGRDVLMEVALETAYNFATNMTMPQAAKLFIQTDSLMNGGINYAKICWPFKNRGILDTCYAPPPDGIFERNGGYNTGNYKVFNTEGFASGEGYLIIQSETPGFQYAVYDLNGRIIYRAYEDSREVQLNPDRFPKGMYILFITGERDFRSEKLIRR